MSRLVENYTVQKATLNKLKGKLSTNRRKLAYTIMFKGAAQNHGSF
jgi:hypothetical protein